MDDLEKQKGTSSRPYQSLCIISKPLVKSIGSYNPINSTQLGNLDNLNIGKASVQDNTDQTTDKGYTIEEKHKSPEQMIIMIITTRWSDHIQENNIKVKSMFGTNQL